MIVLDTNVISAFTRHRQDDTVIQWMNRWDPGLIWTTSVCLFEIEHGIHRVTIPAIQAQLRLRTNVALSGLIKDRFLDFDDTAARVAGQLKALNELRGRPMDDRDLMIASIVMSWNATLATRNVRHFQDLGLQIVNPWDIQ